MALQFTGQSVFVALERQKGYLFLCSKGSDRGTADAPAASHVNGTGNRRRVLGGTSFQPCRRLCMLFTMLATVLPELNKRKA